MEKETVFNRKQGIAQLSVQQDWDVLVIGGGATGLGVAVDAASRGYRTVLLEQADFAKGTSSRSTKLVHGGVRYLAQGNVALVYEALHERELLLKNAPHLVKEQQFIIPVYSWFSRLKYQIGLKLYDLLAGKSSFPSSSFLKPTQVLQAIPGLRKDRLIGGLSYYDGHFDDARLAVNLAQTASAQGAIVLNYMQVKTLLKENEQLVGLTVDDLESGTSFTLRAKTIVNATGVFVDEVLQMDQPSAQPLIRPSQGAHIVLDASFLQGQSALMIPKTADGRVLFAVPWHGKVLIGTTDTPLNAHSLEPQVLEAEVDFILATAGKYLSRQPTRADVRSVFAGLRPLAYPAKDTGSTKEISRSHKLIVSPSGLITITGGKWTTYRKMAMDVIDRAIQLKQLVSRPCITAKLPIYGSDLATPSGHLARYGSAAADILKLIARQPELGEQLAVGKPYLKAEVIWAVRFEMARTLEDVIARRMGLLFLDARLALQLAPPIAAIMAKELGQNEDWMNKQLVAFEHLAQAYFFK